MINGMLTMQMGSLFVPKIIAYTALLYGASYLSSAIQSAIDYVDEWHILHASGPSHGSATSLPNPEAHFEFFAVARLAAGKKLHWHEGDWKQENQQREAIYEFAPDADVILNIDSDEVWTPKVWALLQDNLNWQGAYIRIPFIHFYRNFHHAILHDPAAPARVLFPKTLHRDWAMDFNLETPLLHFGYCQPVDTIRYKLSIHGHRNELRCSPDEYVDTIYKNHERWNDLHPVGSQFWDAELINPMDYLPWHMQTHPFWNREFIE